MKADCDLFWSLACLWSLNKPWPFLSERFQHITSQKFLKKIIKLSKWYLKNVRKGQKKSFPCLLWNYFKGYIIFTHLFGSQKINSLQKLSFLYINLVRMLTLPQLYLIIKLDVQFISCFLIFLVTKGSKVGSDLDSACFLGSTDLFRASKMWE